MYPPDEAAFYSATLKLFIGLIYSPPRYFLFCITIQHSGEYEAFFSLIGIYLTISAGQFNNNFNPKYLVDSCKTTS